MITMGGSDGDRIYLGADSIHEFQLIDFDADCRGRLAKQLLGTYVLEVRATDDDPTILLSKTGVATGVFNLDKTKNTEVLRFTLLGASDITVVKFGDDGGTFRLSLKDTAANVVIDTGDFIVERATQL